MKKVPLKMLGEKKMCRAYFAVIWLLCFLYNLIYCVLWNFVYLFVSFASGFR